MHAYIHLSRTDKHRLLSDMFNGWATVFRPVLIFPFPLNIENNFQLAFNVYLFFIKFSLEENFQALWEERCCIQEVAISYV